MVPLKLDQQNKSYDCSKQKSFLRPFWDNCTTGDFTGDRGGS